MRAHRVNEGTGARAGTPPSFPSSDHDPENALSPDAILLVVLLLATLVCFVFELLPVDVAALGLLFALLVSDLVPLERAFAGFSNQGVLTIGALFVLSHSLVKSGVLEEVADRLGERFSEKRWQGVVSLLLLVALLSGFLNNTAMVALAIPLAMQVCRRFEMSPSKVMMPLSFAAIFGGTLTLIGTSTNLLVSSIVEQEGGPALGMFEFTPLGAVFLVLGLVYVSVFASRLPSRAESVSLTEAFDMGSYLTELRVVDGACSEGRTLQELDLDEDYDAAVVSILRSGRRLTRDLRNVPLEAGDVLLVRSASPDVLRLCEDLDLVVSSDIELGDRELAERGQNVLEVLVSPRSDLIGRTVAGVDFRRRFGAFVLAIRREGETLRQRLAHTRLRFGDSLLVITSEDRVDELRRGGDLVVASELDVPLRRGLFWWLPVLLVPTVMVLAALEVVDLLVGVLGAIVLLLVLRVIRPQESYRAVDWRVVIFIAAFVPVGDAMIRTGLADTLASLVLFPGTRLPESLAPWVAVSVLYLVTSLATETITNNAAAIVLTPVALQMGDQLGVDPRSLVLAICFAGSASFMTPTGYQTNMMVYGAGSYRFTDFTRFGAPLNLLFWIVASLLLPVLYPF